MNMTPYRLTAVINPDSKVIGYEYDSAGNRTKLIDPEGKITTYSYNPNNQLTEVSLRAGGEAISYSYDPNGNQSKVTYPNGVTSEYTYNSRNWLTSLTNKNSSPLRGEDKGEGGGEGELLSSFTYTYDPVGNRTTQKEADGSVVTYGYDPPLSLNQ